MNQKRFIVHGLPLRVLSLWEIMRQFNVWQLVAATSLISDWEFVSQQAHGRGWGDQRVAPDLAEKYIEGLKYIEAQCLSVELFPSVARAQQFAVQFKIGMSWAELGIQAKVLRQSIQNELALKRFAFVLTDKAKTLDDVSKDWGQVWNKFQNAKEDILRAVDCYALEQNTACVFHLMRVAEIGLRAIARKVGVRLRDKGKPMPIEFATWDKVIGGIKSKITAAHAMPKGPRKNRELQFYSDAAEQCTYIRDLWRNEVSHTRENFNDGEALGAMMRVRGFMELLGQKIGDAPKLGTYPSLLGTSTHGPRP